MVVFSQGKRGLKRKANGELRPTRKDLLRAVQPDWWVDRRIRRALGKLPALDDSSPVQICSVCETVGDRVSREDAKRNLDY